MVRIAIHRDRILNCKRKHTGFGSANASIKIYIGNRPPIEDYPALVGMRGLVNGELSNIVKNTSNHWRKAFNVYAKLLFDFYLQQGRKDFPQTWQEYRELELFQTHSCEALLFSPPVLSTTEKVQHIVAGKTYAANLDLPPLVWIDNHFAINDEFRLIVSPYPDYRQLSNERIATLIELLEANVR